MKKFKQIGSKILAGLLTLVLMLSLVSLPVQAAEPVMSWSDVQGIINNATAGEVIDLTKLENTIADTELVISKDITLKGSFTGSKYAVYQIFNLFITVTDNAKVTIKNLAIENKVPTQSVVSGTGNLIVDNSVIESSTRNDVVTSYAPVATIDLAGDVTVLGNWVGGNRPEDSNGSVAGATILDRDGEHTGTAGIAIKAVNVTVSGGFVVGGTSFEPGCNSGDGIVASGDVTILNGCVQSGYGGKTVGIPIRFDSSSTTQQTLLVNNAKVLGNNRSDTGKAAPCTIFMKDIDIAIIDSSTIGWYTNIPLFSAGSYSITNPVKTWGTFTNGIEVFKITPTKASLTNVKTVIKDTVTSYYAAKDTEVAVSANAAETGKVFDGWSSSDVTFKEAENSTTTFIMPAKAVAVEATYKDKSHTHTAGTEWFDNDTYHWHKCTADDGEEMDKATHTYGAWVTDKEATEIKNGSKHRDCTVCNQRETVEIPTIGVTPEEPVISVGNGSTHQISNGQDMTLTCTGKLEDLLGIYVDDKLVDPSHYTLKSGSTILTLKSSYLDTLSAGNHTLKFQYKDNLSADTTFTISTNPETSTSDPVIEDTDTPKTGDISNSLIYFSLIVLSGCAVMFVFRRKQHLNK